MTDQQAIQAQPPVVGGGLANDTDAGTLLVSTSASIARKPPTCQPQKMATAPRIPRRPPEPRSAKNAYN